MISSPRSMVGRRLRVLLAGGAGTAGIALSAWLGERETLDVAGPAKTIGAALELAAKFSPDVVLLDFHGLPLPISHTVSLFKERSPSPLVLVLTHDSSVTMRRRCYGARVDGVFDKTADLETVVALLEQTRRYLAATPAHSSTDATAPKPRAVS